MTRVRGYFGDRKMDVLVLSDSISQDLRREHREWDGSA